MFLELLKILLPSLLVFLAGYLAIERLLREETRRRKTEITLGSQKISLPIRLQAYERITLFLERISPESLLVRVNEPNMTVHKLHSALLGSIRAEWEHNLSQQLYVSSATWGLVKNAKDNVVKLISLSAEKINPKEPSISLSQNILEKMVELEQHPTTLAIEHLRYEVKELF
jgi:hypothetical protein